MTPAAIDKAERHIPENALHTAELKPAGTSGDRRPYRLRNLIGAIAVMLPVTLGMIRLGPGPVISVPPMIVQVHPGVAGGTAGRGVAVNVSFSAQDRMRDARRLIRSGHLTKALNIYQHVLETFGTHLIRVGRGRYISVQDYVWQALFRSPAAKNGLYNQIFGLSAQKAITSAQARGDRDAELSACNRYLLTTTAVDALMNMSDRFFEAGHFSRALRIDRKLLADPAARSHRASLLFRAATAAKLSGHPRLTARFENELKKKYSTAEGTVLGRRRNLARALAAFLPRMTAPPQSNTLYTDSIPPAPGAAVSPGAVPNTVLWNRVLTGLAVKVPANAAAAQYLMNSMTSALSAFGLNTGDLQSGSAGAQLMYSFPTLQHHLVYIDTLSQIQALNASSGYPHWVYPRTAPAVNAQAVANLAFLATGADQIDCSVRAGRVVGLMTKRVTSDRAGTPYQINPMYTYLYHPQGFHVVCLSAADGSVLWMRSSRTLPGHAICSPMLTRSGVFLLTASPQGTGMQARLTLIKLDVKSGATIWAHYLCTISGQAFQSPSLNVSATPTGNRLYVATDAGADLAVSQRSGRICWLHFTVNPVPVSNNPFGYGAPSFRILPWKLNRPIVTRRYVISSVSGEHRIWRINVYRRVSGRRIASFAPPGKLALSILAGISGKAIILTGAYTAAFDETTGKTLWTGARAISGLAGRPVLTDQLLYLPTRHHLIAESIADGHQVMQETWPTGQDGRRGLPGNLLMGRHNLIAVNDEAVSSYARWKNALAYLTARIRRSPDRPENYLTVAQVAYSAGHFRLCRHFLRQGLQTARRTQSSAVVLDALFRGAMDFARRSESNHRIQPADVAFFFHAAAEAARDPHQQAAWRFAQARYLLHRHHPRRALALCQQILTSIAIRRAALTLDGNALPAEAVLATFIRMRIIRAYGAALYQPWRQSAEKLIATAAGSPTLLAQVAYGYPNSPSAQVAAPALIRLLTTRGQWGAAYRVALRALGGVPRLASPCTVKAALAKILLHLHHYRQAYVVARAAERCPGVSALHMTALGSVISACRPHLGSFAATMNFTPKSSFVISRPIRGALLIPAQRSRRLQCRFGVLLAGSHHIRFLQADGELAPWSVKLAAGSQRVALIGTHSDISLLVSPKHLIGVNIKTGSLVWRRRLRNMVNPGTHPSLHDYSDSNLPIQPFVPPSPQAGFVYVNGVMQATPINVNIGPLMPIMARIERFTGPSQFNFVRWTHVGIAVGIGGRMILLNPETGNDIWAHPLSVKADGKLTSARSVGSSLILAFGSHYHRIIAVRSTDGRVEADVPLSAPGGYERLEPGPDGNVFLIGPRRTSAFRTSPAGLALVWSRRIINPLPRLATRTFVGIVEFQHHGIICLNAATGTTRWHIPMLTGAVSGIAGKDMDLASFADTVIARTPSDLAAYSADSGQIRWRAEIMTRETPPLVRMIPADPDIALLACGPAGNLNRSEKLILINQRDRHGRLDNGSIVLSKPLVISAADGNGPVIQSWYVLNNSIIFSLDGRIFAYHADR